MYLKEWQRQIESCTYGYSDANTKKHEAENRKKNCTTSGVAGTCARPKSNKKN